MPPKKNNHFVPKFYLRNFGSEQSVPMFNIRSRMFVPRASLSGQCQRPYLYGRTGELEEALAALEASVAPTIRGILASHALPNKDTPEYTGLVSFVCMQMSRSPQAGEEVTRMMTLMTRAMLRDSADPPPEELRVVHDNPVVFAMGIASRMAVFLHDLKPILIRNDSSVGFITSDCPAVKFNQWAQRVTSQGVLGLASRGLQIFLPLSRALMLTWQDEAIYSTVKRVRLLNAHSVQGLNALQLTTAVDNLYFDGCPETLASLHRLPFSWRDQADSRERVVEAESVEDPSRSLFHTFRQMIGRLDIPEIRIKLAARAVSEEERGGGCRYPPATMAALQRDAGIPEPPPPPRHGGVFRAVRTYKDP